MGFKKSGLFIIILGFFIGILYSVIGALLGEGTGIVILAVAVAAILVYLLYNQLQQ
jgi:hypothetical protein